MEHLDANSGFAHCQEMVHVLMHALTWRTDPALRWNSVVVEKEVLQSPLRGRLFEMNTSPRFCTSL